MRDIDEIQLSRSLAKAGYRSEPSESKTMIVIPSNGAVGDKSQLAFYRDLLVGTREKVAS
jgi:hypothetical protein